MKGKKIFKSLLNCVNEISEGSDQKPLMKSESHLVRTSLSSAAASPNENHNRNGHVKKEEDVDKAAEEFIIKFHRSLQMQKMEEDQIYQGYLARSA
ncbi:hypothetical protein SUGI_0203380 [Cryptomeria japonica]|nr:hypothetical protein SUGI_0203380 [Cryptomeria japonica]